MKKVLIVGATGYLGHFVTKAYKQAGYWVRILARSNSKAEKLCEYSDEVYVGQATKPETIKDICRDIDVVFSSLGITRQKGRFGYWDVDYLANHNILILAKKNKVKKFVFVSVLNPHLVRHLDMVGAKEMFVSELRLSGLNYSIVRPTGFFSDIAEFMKMAESGRIYMVGNGQKRINPIHGEDLAKVCVSCVTTCNQEIHVGGPCVYTWEKIARLAFKRAGRTVKITNLPKGFVNWVVGVFRLFSEKKYNIASFGSIIMQNDMVGPKTGEITLESFLGIGEYKSTVAKRLVLS